MLKLTRFSGSGVFLYIAFFVYGFVSLCAQLLLLRELGVLFYGNELFIGFSLGLWLLWVGAGNWAGRRFPAAAFPWLLTILAFALPIEITLIRFSKTCFGFGMIPGPVETLMTTAVLLFPLCFISGSLFSAGCSFSKDRRLDAAGIYCLESFGAVAAGVTYTFILAGRFSNFFTAWGLGLSLIIANYLLICTFVTRKKFHTVFFIFYLLFFLGASFSSLDLKTRRLEWKGYQFLDSLDSRFGNLVLTQTGNLKELFRDGLITASFPDPRSHEEIAHWPLLAHPDPKDIFLTGGAATGELREILKHPVRRVEVAEIDGSLFKFLKPVLSPGDLAALKDPRLRVHLVDGRFFLKHTPNAYDCILLNLPEPSNAQINRFYTQEFFQEAKKRLRPGGILALAIPSSENYLPPQMAFYNSSIFLTLRSVFKEVSLVPGTPLIYLAHDNPLNLDPGTLADRTRERGLNNTVVVPSYFGIKLDPARVQFFLDKLTRGPRSDLNRDFLPVTYYYSWKVWLLKFQDPTLFLWAFAFVTLFVLVARFLRRRKMSLSWRDGSAVILTLGFSGMVYEILVLLAFQAKEGYIYSQMGFLFAAAMSGIALGGWVGARKKGYSPKQNSLLLSAQAVLGLLLAVLFSFYDAAFRYFPAIILFVLLMIPIGFIPGYGFASLARSFSPAKLYTADLFGGGCGAIFTGLFLVPILGILKLYYLSAVLLFAIGWRLRRKKAGG
ncbi:MAG: hypothetical protein AUJ71_04245 [Candidatus Omnitrophica bacterium CG1_02_49_16]|nr:MAG: hypothetical protein AUJ71_04245 [Candidatus Omnitrophica bacterium CG1_02_49_16]